MEEKVEKINFFKKIWYSITKFEQYPRMAMGGLKRAIKYLILLTAIVTLFVMIGSLLQMKTLVEDLANYVQDNIPEFSYSDGKLIVQSETPIVIDNVEYIGIDRIVINTLSETDENKEQVEKDNLIIGTTIFFFDDEIILKSKSESDEIVRQPYTYSDFIAGYTGENVEQFNKTEFVQFLTSEKMRAFYGNYALSIFIYLLIVNVMVALLDSLEIALLGWITTTVARIRMRFSAIYNMAIYSLTLPMILNILYIVINYFTSFTITYFQVAYITIAYIYLAASIFILKDDFIKKMQEVEKIKQEQVNVREEIEEQEEKKEEEEKKEDNKDPFLQILQKIHYFYTLQQLYHIFFKKATILKSAHYNK